MGREFELKFRADEKTLERLEKRYDNLTAVEMETVYFDTAEGDFSRRRWTFRCRMENGRPVCTLKTPAAGGARGEWETESGNPAAAAPALVALGAPAALPELIQKGLMPVCGARFTRRCCILEENGTRAELALDRGVLLGGGREIPLFEVELELKAGTDEAVTAMARRLAAEFGLQEEKKSKYCRALALAKGETNGTV